MLSGMTKVQDMFLGIKKRNCHFQKRDEGNKLPMSISSCANGEHSVSEEAQQVDKGDIFPAYLYNTVFSLSLACRRAEEVRKMVSQEVRKLDS